ncbi:hypothetical protein AYX14_02363 [Cryptococcus neoformans]|nr:hypothetical protein AYX15_02707 [Cryptococcus neoformans var. grubii]OWZ72140.1 hypothetical protein AYX14_02363 [Cryptococcus neoformans var. grubii]
MLWTHRCPRRKSFNHGQVYRCVFFSRMRKVVDHLQKVMQTFFGRGQEERQRSWCEGQWELSQKKKPGKRSCPWRYLSITPSMKWLTSVSGG